MRLHLLIPIVLLSSPALAATTPICVTNGSEATHLFAAESRGGQRLVSELAPGARLCVPGTGRGGVVSVWESAEAVEGCSRLVAAGGEDTLLRFAEFDRCAWASHDR